MLENYAREWAAPRGNDDVGRNTPIDWAGVGDVVDRGPVMLLDGELLDIKRRRSGILEQLRHFGWDRHGLRRCSVRRLGPNGRQGQQSRQKRGKSHELHIFTHRERPSWLKEDWFQARLDRRCFLSFILRIQDRARPASTRRHDAEDRTVTRPSCKKFADGSR